MSLFKKFLFSALGVILLPVGVQAVGDLGLQLGDVRLDPSEVIAGQKTRVYATVRNAGNVDATGRVQFFDESAGVQVSSDQAVSAVAGQSDTVFVDWVPLSGERRLRISIFPNEADSDPENDSVLLIFFADTDFDGDGIGDASDPDDDNDGYPDAQDAFPKNENEWQDTDGDGIGDNLDSDDDNDGLTDNQESNMCTSQYLRDTDGDGVGDAEDAFPCDASEWQDTDGDGIGDNADPDDDGDGVLDGQDAFPQDGTEQSDHDGDGTGDNADSDDDNDGLSDAGEARAGTDPYRKDTDGDGWLDGDDAFPLDASEWLDTDGDGEGNNTDVDDDDDGYCDRAPAIVGTCQLNADGTADAFPLDPTEWHDMDGDGVGDNSDPDRDGDGCLNEEDSFPSDARECRDSDGDGKGDKSDPLPQDAAPQAKIKGETERKAKVGEEVTFDGSESNDKEGAIALYVWDFGDGVQGEGAVTTHTYLEAGEYEVKLSVKDSAGDWAGAQVQVQVRSDLWLWIFGLGAGAIFLLALIIFLRKLIKIEKEAPPSARFKEVKIEE